MIEVSPMIFIFSTEAKTSWAKNLWLRATFFQNQTVFKVANYGRDVWLLFWN